MTDPIRPTDDEARALARSLILNARFAALGVIEPATGAPMVTRIGIAPDADRMPMALVSDLSQHTRALMANPACSVLIGEPGARGDPLTHPRLTLQGRAAFVRHGDAEHERLAAQYLHHQPKAKLYIGFADFSLLRVTAEAAYLNGGFGKAFVLTPADLAAPPVET
ncbi:HugZ family pyridoxamine 5'-phosphate oxidase [Citreimonas sp.]|uniref:HugZ family pyridoxamine 5'-phosphate oxidase n=1 Tax=Citreimonas sp. TaxID=3036715 RepID=UPI00405A33CE